MYFTSSFKLCSLACAGAPSNNNVLAISVRTDSGTDTPCQSLVNGLTEPLTLPLANAPTPSLASRNGLSSKSFKPCCRPAVWLPLQHAEISLTQIQPRVLEANFR